MSIPTIPLNHVSSLSVALFILIWPRNTQFYLSIWSWAPKSSAAVAAKYWFVDLLDSNDFGFRITLAEHFWLLSGAPYFCFWIMLRFRGVGCCCFWIVRIAWSGCSYVKWYLIVPLLCSCSLYSPFSTHSIWISFWSILTHYWQSVHFLFTRSSTVFVPLSRNFSPDCARITYVRNS